MRAPPVQLMGAALAAGCLIFTGCGKSSLKTVPVRGTVTYQGKPLTFGLVSFQPVDSIKGRPATASIQPDGSFVVRTLATAPGLMPGDYLISVAASRPADLAEDPGSMSQGNGERAGGPDIPMRYLNPTTSGLKLTVAASDRSKTVDLVLENK